MNALPADPCSHPSPRMAAKVTAFMEAQSTFVVRFHVFDEEAPVPSVDVFLPAEGVPRFAARRAAAAARREESALLMLYALYAESMPTEGTAVLSPEHVSRMLEGALNSRRMKEHSDLGSLVKEARRAARLAAAAAALCTAPLLAPTPLLPSGAPTGHR